MIEHLQSYLPEPLTGLAETIGEFHDLSAAELSRTSSWDKSDKEELAKLIRRGQVPESCEKELKKSDITYWNRLAQDGNLTGFSAQDICDYSKALVIKLAPEKDQTELRSKLNLREDFNLEWVWMGDGDFQKHAIYRLYAICIFRRTGVRTAIKAAELPLLLAKVSEEHLASKYRKIDEAIILAIGYGLGFDAWEQYNDRSDYPFKGISHDWLQRRIFKIALALNTVELKDRPNLGAEQLKAEKAAKAAEEKARAAEEKAEKAAKLVEEKAEKIAKAAEEKAARQKAKDDQLAQKKADKEAQLKDAKDKKEAEKAKLKEEKEAKKKKEMAEKKSLFASKAKPKASDPDAKPVEVMVTGVKRRLSTSPENSKKKKQLKIDNFFKKGEGESSDATMPSGSPPSDLDPAADPSPPEPSS